jgi:hypothetical protein
VDRHPQAVRRQAERPRQELPAIVDGLLLEVVPEGEVPQHLEKGVVAGGPADILQVVVLAAGPDAFLYRDGPGVGSLLLAGEDILELDHPSVGEEQRRVRLGNQEGTLHLGVALSLEVIQECLPEFVPGFYLRCHLPSVSVRPPG